MVKKLSYYNIIVIIIIIIALVLSIISINNINRKISLFTNSKKEFIDFLTGTTHCMCCTGGFISMTGLSAILQYILPIINNDNLTFYGGSGGSWFLYLGKNKNNFNIYTWEGLEVIYNYFYNFYKDHINIGDTDLIVQLGEFFGSSKAILATNKKLKNSYLHEVIKYGNWYVLVDKYLKKSIDNFKNDSNIALSISHSSRSNIHIVSTAIAEVTNNWANIKDYKNNVINQVIKSNKAPLLFTRVDENTYIESISNKQVTTETALSSTSATLGILNQNEGTIKNTLIKFATWADSFYDSYSYMPFVEHKTNREKLYYTIDAGFSDLTLLYNYVNHSKNNKIDISRDKILVIIQSNHSDLNQNYNNKITNNFKIGTEKHGPTLFQTESIKIYQNTITLSNYLKYIANNKKKINTLNCMFICFNSNGLKDIPDGPYTIANYKSLYNKLNTDLNSF